MTYNCKPHTATSTSPLYKFYTTDCKRKKYNRMPSYESACQSMTTGSLLVSCFLDVAGAFVPPAAVQLLCLAICCCTCTEQHLPMSKSGKNVVSSSPNTQGPDHEDYAEAETEAAHPNSHHFILVQKSVISLREIGLQRDGEIGTNHLCCSRSYVCERRYGNSQALKLNHIFLSKS